MKHLKEVNDIMKNASFKTLLILASILAFAAPVPAFMSKSDVGTSTAQFLKLGMGGQANAMGEAVTALVNDSTAICWNPAGLNGIGNGHVSLMHCVYLDGMFYDYATAAMLVEDAGVIGIGFQYFNAGTITGIEEDGSLTGDFTPNDLSIALSYATKLFSVPVGINAKYISSTIQNTATAVAFDIGTQYSFLDQKLFLGMVLQNLGTKIKYDQESENLPLNLRIGAGYKIIENLIVEVDASLPNDNTIIIGAGSELGLSVSDDLKFSLRAGYNTRTADISGFKGLSCGAGINVNSLGFDYALVPFGDLGLTHRISVSAKL